MCHVRGDQSITYSSPHRLDTDESYPDRFHVDSSFTLIVTGLHGTSPHKPPQIVVVVKCTGSLLDIVSTYGIERQKKLLVTTSIYDHSIFGAVNSLLRLRQTQMHTNGPQTSRNDFRQLSVNYSSSVTSVTIYWLNTFERISVRRRTSLWISAGHPSRSGTNPRLEPGRISYCRRKTYRNQVRVRHSSWVMKIGSLRLLPIRRLTSEYFASWNKGRNKSVWTFVLQFLGKGKPKYYTLLRGQLTLGEQSAHMHTPWTSTTANIPQWP